MESDDLLAEYAERKRLKALGQDTGVLFGIPALDLKVGGMQKGELNLMAGYSGGGKSSLSVQLAWNAATQQGLNVVFATTETLRVQIRRKLLARHSRLPMFELPEGLNTRDIRDASLTPMAESKYRDVIADLSTNSSYGKLHIAQVPRGATVGTLEARLSRLQRQFHVDLLIVDYLALFRSDRKRQSDREELNSIIKEAKQLATTFNDGHGVPVVSPWQVSRNAHSEAEKVGYYTSASLAETSEATNSSDIIVSLFAMDNNERYADVSMQILKNRDGETSGSMALRTDYATCWFAERSDNAVSSVTADDALAGLSDEILSIV
jgi:replicative DNA helicase